jgi:hypothetical protein
MLAGAAPNRFSIRNHFRKDNHARKARKFGSSIDGVASCVDYFAADSLLSGTPPEPRTGLHGPRLCSVIKNPALHVGLLARSIAATEFTGLAFRRTL